LKDQTGIERALIARGILSAVILATDGPTIDWQVHDIPADGVEEVLGDWLVPGEPGFYLFEGVGTWKVYGAPWDSGEPELEWEGKTRPVEPGELGELAALLNMTPLEETS